MKKKLFLIPLVLLMGCFQAYNNDDESLRAVPVTNNPNIIPHHSSFPGMGESAPY